MTNSLVRGLLIAIAVVGGLAILKNRPWERKAAEPATVAGAPRAQLKVGFLPVT